MKTLKKLFILLFAFVMICFCFSTILKVGADSNTSDKIQVLGAGIRTTGNAGMRFKASVKGLTLPEGRSISKYGILFAHGESTDFEKGDKVGDYDVLFCEVDDLDEVEEEAYYVTIFGIPEEDYSTDVTTRAYVVLDDDSIIYGTSPLTRNIYEVALQCISDTLNYPEGGIPFIENLVKFSSLEYNGGSLDPLKSFTIGAFNGGTGGTSGIIMGNISGITTAKYWFKAAIKAVPDHPGYYEVVETAVSGKSLTGLERDYVIAAFENDKTNYNVLKTVSASNYLYVSEAESGATVKVYPKADYVLNNKGEFKEGDSLPSAKKDYYRFVGWYNNPEFNGNPITTHVAGNGKYFAKYEPANYLISYKLNGGVYNGSLISTYNIESNEIVLPKTGLSISGGTFIGWYSDESFTNEISSIPTGSHGDITIYAKWNIPTLSIDLTSDKYKNNANALSNITPDIIVGSLETATKYNFINSGNEELASKTYETGLTHFTSITDAITKCEAGDIIYVLSGSYPQALTISKAVTLYGSNYGIKGTSTRNVETILSGIVTIKASNVKVEGFNLNGKVNATANISNLSILNNVIGVSGGFDSQNNTVTNLNYSGNYANNYSAAFEFYGGIINGLTYNDNTIIGKPGQNLCDAFYVKTCLYGEVEMNRNRIENCYQAGFHAMGVGAMTINIKDCVFKNITCTSVDFRDMKTTKPGNVTMNIIHCTFDNAGNDWYTIRPRTASYGTNKLVVNVHYCSFINLEPDTSGVYVYCNNPSGGKIYYADNNYFQGVKANELTDANFNGCAYSYANCYDSSEAVEEAYLAYLG